MSQIDTFLQPILCDILYIHSRYTILDLCLGWIRHVYTFILDSYLYQKTIEYFDTAYSITNNVLFGSRVEPETAADKEPKFIVFYSMLLSLFSDFCFNCKEEKPVVSMKKNGTMVTVTQECSKCLYGFTWSSQPLIMGGYAAGNILLSFAILMGGGSISKVALVFRHMGLAMQSVRSYFRHQRRFLFPAIFRYWQTYRKTCIERVKAMDEAVWSGDGRFDSMGHSAKYGVYSMFCTSDKIMKILHFEIVQV